MQARVPISAIHTGWLRCNDMRGVMAFGKNHMLPRRFVHVGTLRHFAYTEGSFAID